MWDVQVGKQHLHCSNPKSVKQYPDLQQKKALVPTLHGGLQTACHEDFPGQFCCSFPGN